MSLTSQSSLNTDSALKFPGGSDGKASVYNAGNPGSSPGLGRSLGEGNGNPLQYYCLENPIPTTFYYIKACFMTVSVLRL